MGNQLSHHSRSAFKKNTNIFHVWVMTVWLTPTWDASRPDQRRAQQLHAAFPLTPREYSHKRVLLGCAQHFPSSALSRQGERQGAVEPQGETSPEKGQTVPKTRSARNLMPAWHRVQGYRNRVGTLVSLQCKSALTDTLTAMLFLAPMPAGHSMDMPQICTAPKALDAFPLTATKGWPA